MKLYFYKRKLKQTSAGETVFILAKTSTGSISRSDEDGVFTRFGRILLLSEFSFLIQFLLNLTSFYKIKYLIF